MKTNMEQWMICEEGPWAVSDEGRMCLMMTRNNKHKAGLLIKFRPIRNKRRKKHYLGTVLTCYDGKKRMIQIAKMVAKYFIGPRPGCLTINHIDADKANNRASNLEYISLQANIDHAVKRGLYDFASKISDADVLTIRKLIGERSENGLSAADIGAMFNVSPSYARFIGFGRRRKWVA